MEARERRGVSVAMLAALAAVPAIVLGGVWQYADANVPPPTTTTTTTIPAPPVDELATDLLSFRRHPAPLAEAVAAADSEEAFAQLALDLTDEIGPGSCLRIASAGDGGVVAEIAPTLPVIPASNQKLLVAAVALEVLGADYRFRTLLESTPPVDGVVTGNVYLVGGGDPVLVTADVPDPLRYPAFNTTSLDSLADLFVGLGITRIDGEVVGDGSRYDNEFRPPSWGDDITNLDGGPLDALLVNDGQLSPGNYGLNPNRSAARVFADLLLARGVTVTLGAGNSERPPGLELTTLAMIESEPLSDILVELLHTSDNNTAEMLLKEIGFVATGEGTRQAGLDTVWSTLATWGVPLDGVALHDGSGISRENRLTCATLEALMSVPPVADELIALLPVAGRDGTLAPQLIGTEAEGQLQAKTGTLTGVKSLTGVQPDRLHDEIAFAVVLNGENVDDLAVYEPVWKRLVALIDDYPIVIEPDLSEFVPR